jgi:hypothetical protein
MVVKKLVAMHGALKTNVLTKKHMAIAKHFCAQHPCIETPNGCKELL